MITYKSGSKHPLDKKIFWNGIPVEMPDIAEIVLQLCRNEDNIYPKSNGRLMGGQMLLFLLQEVYNNDAVTDALLKRYRLGNYRPSVPTRTG
jgi:hypothetical protein